MATKKDKQTTIEAHAEVIPPAELEPHDPWADVKNADELTLFQRLKVLLYGPSGGGKTRLAALFRAPLIGCTELQGIPTITHVNPKAKVHLIQTPEDMAAFKKLIMHPKLAERCDAVIMDGVTDVQRIMKSFYLSRQSKGQDSIHMDTWGKIIDSTAALVRQVRDLPVHVIVTALSEEESIEGEGRFYRPSVYGKKLPNDLAQYFNLVGYVFKRSTQRDPGVRHEVMFQAPDRYMSKGMPQLNATEAPEPLLWISKVFGLPVPPDVAERVAAWERLGLPTDEAAPVPTPDGATPPTETKTSTLAADPFAASR